MMFARQSARALTATSLRSTAGRKQLSTSRKLALRLHKASVRQKSTFSRHKSTAAAAIVDYEDDEDVVTNASLGHAAAAEAAASMDKSHEEAWMVNLGRGNENEWLTGPRPEEWFTGLAPCKCPGKPDITRSFGYV
jgi:hypothetical protein